MRPAWLSFATLKAGVRECIVALLALPLLVMAALLVLMASAFLWPIEKLPSSKVINYCAGLWDRHVDR